MQAVNDGSLDLRLSIEEGTVSRWLLQIHDPLPTPPSLWEQLLGCAGMLLSSLFQRYYPRTLGSV